MWARLTSRFTISNILQVIYPEGRKKMVPLYRVVDDRTTATYLSNTNTQTSTVGPDTNYMDQVILTLTQIKKDQEKEDLANLLPYKPAFDRVMKTRNTDGHVRPLPVWRPMRLVSRGNIGVRNFQAR